MSIELHEGDYVAAVFVVHGKEGNVLAMLTRPVAAAETWCLQFRFRYYVDTRVFESDDRKSFYTVTLDGAKTEEEIIAQIAEAMPRLARPTGGGDLEVVRIGTVGHECGDGGVEADKWDGDPEARGALMNWYLLTLNAIAWGALTYAILLVRRCRREMREIKEMRARVQANLEESERIMARLVNETSIPEWAVRALAQGRLTEH